MKIKVLIIDDEEMARNLVKTYLNDYDALEIVGECANGFDGLKAIKEKNPDLVFLDIQMPKLTGFEMLELMDDLPDIIFTTAYDQYAIKAFDNNAVDYLLKPFSRDRFRAAIEKFMEKYKVEENKPKAVQNLLEEMDDNGELLERIVVRLGAKIKIILTENIRYLESQDDYVMIYTPDGKYLKKKTMGYFEKHLDPNDFVRIHRSYIVRVDQIGQLELYGKDSYIAALKDGSKLSVSRSGYTRLKQVLSF